MTVSTSRGSYEITFSALADACKRLEDAIVITDENVFRLYGACFDADQVIVLPPGEQTKSMEWFGKCLEQLAHKNAHRASTLVAFGGGVIGDLAGFVASAYMRGIDYYQLPSTLMAQVDSSIGGKVGIDLAAGKNLAGAFYPPIGVFICPELLKTLDARQFNSGMAEVWKYAFIAGEPNVEEVSALYKSQINLLVEKCIGVKARIVQEDEFEKTGARAILNFGHTIGHAIESVTGYRDFLHGEAISIGMVAEAKLGEALGITKQGTSERVRDCLRLQGLPVEMPALSRRALLECMARDKKRAGKGLSFSLLTAVGECKLVKDIGEPEVERALFHS